MPVVPPPWFTTFIGFGAFSILSLILILILFFNLMQALPLVWVPRYSLLPFCGAPPPSTSFVICHTAVKMRQGRGTRLWPLLLNPKLSQWSTHDSHPKIKCPCRTGSTGGRWFLPRGESIRQTLSPSPARPGMIPSPSSVSWRPPTDRSSSSGTSPSPNRSPALGTVTMYCVGSI